MGADIMINLAMLITSIVVAVGSAMVAFHRMSKKLGSSETLMENLSRTVESHDDIIQTIRLEAAKDRGEIATLTRLVESLCVEQRQANLDMKNDMRHVTERVDELYQKLS